MRASTDAHLARRWRIHGLLADFRLEDVWTLPTTGRREDFSRLVKMFTEFAPAQAESLPTRLLWTTRDRLGEWFGLGRIATRDESPDVAASLLNRLPPDLRDGVTNHRFLHLPFQALYCTEDEFAAEISNATVHGVMHLGWVDGGDGLHHAEMSVYVKPRGIFGRAYMAFIRPFRYLIVYPALERQMHREWIARMEDPTSS